MDFMLYAMAIGQLRAYYGFDDSTAGLAGTVTLATASIGGVLFGFVANRFGRARAMMATGLVCRSRHSAPRRPPPPSTPSLAWGARPRHGRRVGDRRGARERDVSAGASQLAISVVHRGWALGYILAAVLAAGVLGNPALGPEAWRWLFVIGVVYRLSSRSGSGGACVSPKRGPGRGHHQVHDNTLRVIFGRKLRAHDPRDPARLVRLQVYRVLGNLLLAARVPCAPDSRWRRRHGRGPVARLDHSRADRRVPFAAISRSASSPIASATGAPSSSSCSPPPC